MWFLPGLPRLLFFFRKDSFVICCGTYLGQLSKIRIGHDNTGFGAAWFLDKVSVLRRNFDITALYNNMRTLKFKAQLTNAFFATVNQMFGGFFQLPTMLSELYSTI